MSAKLYNAVMVSRLDPSAGRRAHRRACLAAGILLAALAGAAAGILAGYAFNIPDVQSLEDYRPDVITEVYADDNSVIGELCIERRMVVPYEAIPQHLRAAILATEDTQFFSHSGIDYVSILRAVAKDLIRRSFPVGKGASTITQQLSRMLLLSNEKTYDRKIKEVLIARKIEAIYTKQQIFALYCNLHPMGHGIYGVAAAADSYFGKKLGDLNLQECALIAGLPSNPSRFSPRLHPASAVARRNFVLDRMAEEGMISRDLAASAKTQPLVLKQEGGGAEIPAAHFLEHVRKYLAERYSTDEIWRRGLRVYTTLDASMQEAAHRALVGGLEAFDKRHGWRGPVGTVGEPAAPGTAPYAHPSWRTPPAADRMAVGLITESDAAEAQVRIGDYSGRIGPEQIRWTGAAGPSDILKPGDLAWFRIHIVDEKDRTVTLSLEQKPEVDGAIVAVDNRTGAIRAMAGGYDFQSSEFNRATQAMRQVGSTIKPLVYAAAFEKGFTRESTVQDTPYLLVDGLGRPWRPLNYDGEFKGEVTVGQALVESRNVPTVRVAEAIGIENVVRMARRFGLSGPMKPYLSLAIGAAEATPLEMASAYTVFPNLGIRATPYFIREVEDYDHRTKEETRPATQRVLEPGIAGEILDLLQEVVASGTAKAAATLGRPLGGKTGTTDDFTDAWFVGFSPSITAAVWIGHDRNRPLGRRQSGSVVALPVWIEFMGEILAGRPVEAFQSSRTKRYASPDSTPYKRRHLYIETLTESGPEEP